MTNGVDNLEVIARDCTPFEKRLDQTFIWITCIFAIGVAIVLFWIGGQVLWQALPAFSKFGLNFLISTPWNPPKQEYGVLPQMYGTIVSSLIALLFAVPIGLGTAILLSEDFLPTKVQTIMAFLIELLAAIPSVVYGLWGFFVVIPILKPIGSFLHSSLGFIPIFSTPFSGPGMLTSSIVLTIMILPIITAISRDSLVSLPPTLRQASLGLGATRWETIIRVLVPAAFSGIVGGIMLALGRAMGETMAVTLLMGNANRISVSILAPANTISSLLANQFAEASNSNLQLPALMYAGLVLFVLTFVVNILAEVIVRRVKKF